MEHFIKWLKTERGRNKSLARELGISTVSIHYWQHREKRVPVNRVLDVERITSISRHDLRPDIYGPKQP